jgi:molybdopterin-guanine dinucleotide biosynthesis protein A
MSRPTIAAAILAGGQARRFGGRDKSRLVIEGRPIIVRQVEALQQVADEIFVVSPDVARFADIGLPVHPDLERGAGAIGGLHTALETATADRVLVVACDLPYLDARVLERLAALAAGADAAWVRTPRGVEPLLACYRRSARTVIHAELRAGRRKLADLDRVLQIVYLDAPELAAFGPVDRLVANVNSVEDYDKLQS